MPLGYITASTTYALKTVRAPDLPNNEGSFRAVRVVVSCPRALGGGPAAPLVLRTSTGRELHAMGYHVLEPGEEIAIEMPGGGGYGDPFARDPERVLRDVRGGYVSAERARTDYGVVVDPTTWTVDAEATRSLRDTSAASRRAR